MGEEKSEIENLLVELRNAGQWHRYFDALALSARFDLGLPLILSPEAQEFPTEQRVAYENRLTDACREVGGRLLQSSDFRGAFHYLSTIGELEAVRNAIEAFAVPADVNDNEASQNQVDAVLEIALGHGVHPRKGLEVILERSGTCQGITACQNVIASETRIAVRQECAQLVVRRLHAELLERVKAEIRHVEGSDPQPDNSLVAWIEARPWLFENDNYHVDTSHLNSAVRFARLLPNGPEARLAMDLCEYGRRLSEKYAFGEAAPFERIYDDTLVYLGAIVGDDTETGIEHFRNKADTSDREVDETYPAEVYVNLLVALGKLDEAIAFAGKALNSRNGGVGLSCPSVNELCRIAGRFDLLQQYAIDRKDVVSMLAARLTKPWVPAKE